MSWRDRDYYRNQPNPFDRPSFSFGLPAPTPIVKYLLIANVAMFVITALTGAGRQPGYYRDPGTLGGFLALQPIGFAVVLRFWTLVTYQFLHGGTFHLLFNMIGLYFLGPPLERLWGSKQFLAFYLYCGVVGGLVFLVISGLTGQIGVPIIGASGAILGILAACAVLFPQMMIIFLFFPLPIRVAALILGALYILNILSTGDLSDACHFGGMAAALAYLWGRPWFRQFQSERKRGQWEQRQREAETEEKEVDRILEKVHREGIQSLSRSEKRILQRATERQRGHEKELDERFRRR